MTTIAIKDGVVAADSQLTSGNYAVTCQKVFRLPDGGVASGSGEWPKAYAGIKWLLDGEEGDPPGLEGAEVYIVRPDKKVWIADGQFPAYPLGYEYAAGCGADLARQLMRQGKSPMQAVTEACELDAMSSGPVLYMAVIPPMDTEPQTYRPAPRKKARK